MVRILLLILLIGVPAHSFAFVVGDVKFDTNSTGRLTDSEISFYLYSFGYFDLAVRFEKNRRNRPDEIGGIREKQAKFEAFLAEWSLPQDTMPNLWEVARLDLDGDEIGETVLLYCRKPEKLIQDHSVMGYPFPMYMRVYKRVKNGWSRWAEGEVPDAACNPHGPIKLQPYPEGNLIQIPVAVTTRADTHAFFAVSKNSVSPNLLAVGESLRPLYLHSSGSIRWEFGMNGATFSQYFKDSPEGGERTNTYTWEGDRYVKSSKK